MDPESGISYEEPSPNTFSFNSPYGSCKKCRGLGSVNSVDISKVIPDDRLSINEVAIAPFGEVRDTHTFKQLRAISKKYKFSFSTPVKDIPAKALNTILQGGDESIKAKVPGVAHDFVYNLAEEGLVNMLVRWYEESSSEKIRSWAEEFMEDQLELNSRLEGYVATAMAGAVVPQVRLRITPKANDEHFRATLLTIKNLRIDSIQLEEVPK